MPRLMLFSIGLFLNILFSSQTTHAQTSNNVVALTELSNAENDSVQVTTYYNRAKELYRSTPSEAAALVEKALHLAQKHELKNLETDLLNLKGVILLKLNKFDESIKTHFEVLKKREAIQDKKGAMLSLLNIGNVFNKSYDPEQAILYYQKALQIAKEIQDAPNRTNIQLNIGNIYAQRALNGPDSKLVNQAINYLVATVEYCQKYTPQIDLFNSYILLSYLYLKAGEVNRSTYYTDKAITITNKRKDPVGESYARINRANIFVQKKQFKLAQQEVEIIKDIIKKSGIKDLNEELSGDFEKIAAAIKAGNTTLILSDLDSSTIETNKNSELIRTKIREELREKYETEKKELENKNLKLHNEVIEKEAKWNRSAWRWTCAVLVIFATLLVLLFNRNKLLTLEKAKVERQSLEIAKQHTALLQADLFRSRIFSVISHDLRTPISNFNALLSLSKIAPIPESEIKIMLVNIGQEVKIASKMLDELLVWSSQQMASERIESNNIVIDEMISESIALFRDRINLKNLSVKCNIAPELIVYTDLKRLEFIIRNMINNAIKFSALGKSITVNAHHGINEIIISVEDQGVGIDENQLAALQGKGRNVSLPGTFEEKGSGIGLMLSQDFAERIGCKISISSTLGLGSIFSLHIPTKEKQMIK